MSLGLAASRLKTPIPVLNDEFLESGVGLKAAVVLVERTPRNGSHLNLIRSTWHLAHPEFELHTVGTLFRFTRATNAKFIFAPEEQDRIVRSLLPLPSSCRGNK